MDFNIYSLYIYTSHKQLHLNLGKHYSNFKSYSDIIGCRSWLSFKAEFFLAQKVTQLYVAIFLCEYLGVSVKQHAT